MLNSGGQLVKTRGVVTQDARRKREKGREMNTNPIVPWLMAAGDRGHRFAILSGRLLFRGANIAH